MNKKCDICGSELNGCTFFKIDKIDDENDEVEEYKNVCSVCFSGCKTHFVKLKYNK